MNLFFLLSGILILASCGKKDVHPPTEEPPVTYPAAVDPAVSNTVGFFLDDWEPKAFHKPVYEESVVPSAAGTSVEIDASKVIAKIPRTIFGQNSVSYVENLGDDADLVNHLKAIVPGVIRFPGGSISDTYFWNRNMQEKPVDAPDSIIQNNTEVLWRWNYWYGRNNNISSRANLDDYYALLQQTGSKGMITVNYAYARYGISDNPVAQAAHLAADWVRYDNGRTKYWEIGNENHGSWEPGYRINTKNNKDGQPEYISGKLYATHAKLFIDSMQKAAAEIGKKIFIGVGLIESQLAPSDWLYNASKAAPEWNKDILSEMKAGPNTPDFYVVHNYFLNNTENTFDKILASAQTKTGSIVTYLTGEFQKYGSPVKPVALTEYNIYATGSAGSMQQVSFANGIHTVIVLGEAIKSNFGSAVRWNLVNGWDNGADHGMFDKGDEPGGRKWNPRPVFYYMYFMQRMLGDRMVASATNNNNILSYASSFTSGEKGVVLVNKSASTEFVKVNVKNAATGERYYWYLLTGGTDNGGFSRSVLVNGLGPDGSATGGPVSVYASVKAKSNITKEGIKISMPPKSVAYVVIDKGN